MSVSLEYLLLPVNELWIVSDYGKKIFEYSGILLEGQAGAIPDYYVMIGV